MRTHLRSSETRGATSLLSSAAVDALTGENFGSYNARTSRSRPLEGWRHDLALSEICVDGERYGTVQNSAVNRMAEVLPFSMGLQAILWRHPSPRALPPWLQTPYPDPFKGSAGICRNQIPELILFRGEEASARLGALFRALCNHQKLCQLSCGSGFAAQPGTFGVHSSRLCLGHWR